MEKNSFLPKADYSDVSTPTGPAPSTNTATSKAGFWDLFLGRLIGTCLVGCWILGAVLIIGSIAFFIYIFNNPQLFAN